MARQSGFTVTSWNLLHAMQIPPNSTATLHDALVEINREIKSDVIALQEVDVHQSRSGNGNQVREVAESIGAPYWAFAPSMYGTPGEKWHGIKEEKIFDNTMPIPPSAMYGIGIVSNVQIGRAHV